MSRKEAHEISEKLAVTGQIQDAKQERPELIKLVNRRMTLNHHS